MAADLEVAYLGVQVSDPKAFGTFLGEVVGLIPADTSTDGATSWRNDDRVHRIIVEEGPANDAVFVGLEAGSPDAFARAVDRARAAGASVTDGSPSEVAARRVEALVRVDTPWGVPFELVHGLALAATPFDSPLVPGGFVTKDQGFGHVVFVVSDLDGGDRFVRDALGFTQSDWLDDGSRRIVADRALLPLQPAPPLPRARRGAFRATPEAPPRDGRDGVA